jgi:HD-like signal output (HDOD) protein
MNTTTAVATPVPAATSPGFDTDRMNIQARLCNLPPLHSIANQVLAMSADPEIDLKRIASVIELDPAFAADVLFLANSSLFGFTSRMHVLRHAVALLGLEHIKTLCITVAMRSFLGDGNPSIKRCWCHSAACALICQRVSGLFRMPPGQAYTAGLMHDIGRLGLLKTYPQKLGPVLQMSYDNTEELCRAESAVLNVDHTTAGAWLVKAWAFPPTFTDIVQHHHAKFSDGDSELLALVKTGCLLANALGYSAVHYTALPTHKAVQRCVSPHGSGRVLPDERALREVVDEKLRAFV